MAHVLGSDFDRCREPLEGEATGEDARYDESFVELKGEIENIASGSVDWERVEKLAVKVLAETSKDLYAMSYLNAALIQRHGFLGLADGFALLRHWIETDWENLYPRKPARSRAFAFSWLVERVAPYIEAREPEDNAEVEVLESLREDFQTLAKIAQEHLGHLAPTFGEIQNLLRKKAETHQPPAESAQGASAEGTADASAETPGTAAASQAVSPDPASGVTPPPGGEAPPTETPETKTPQPGPATTTAPASPARPPTTATAVSQPVEIPDLPPLSDSAGAREIRDQIRAYIGPLRQSGMSSATPYRMLRVLKWQDLQGPPAADPGSGKTRVPAPRGPQRNALANLLTNRRWPELLEASEAAFQNDTGTFWLDLQRYSALALEYHDPTHGPRLAALVIDELRELLDRFPNLHHLTYADGTPFAAPETRQWIEESVRVVEVDVLGGGSGRAEDVVLSDEEIAEAQALFGKKKADEAMDLIQSAIERARNPRAVFRTRLTAAQLCLQAGKMGWSRTLLEQLRQTMDGFRFETWESETATEVYHLLALCCARQLEAAGGEPVPELEEALEEAQGRLFALDLRAAAKVEATLGDQATAVAAAKEKNRTKGSSDIAHLLKQLLGRL